MLHDSGSREEFVTGAQRDTNDGKPCPGLISPYAAMREANILTEGAKKYSSRNWEKGMPFSRVVESIERHLLAYKMGKTDEDHLAQLRVNTGFLLHYEEMVKLGILPAELDDMPKYEQEKVETRPMPAKKFWYDKEADPRHLGGADYYGDPPVTFTDVLAAGKAT